MSLIGGAAKDQAIGELPQCSNRPPTRTNSQTATFTKQKWRANQSVAWCTRVLNKKWAICTNYEDSAVIQPRDWKEVLQGRKEGSDGSDISVEDNLDNLFLDINESNIPA